MNTLRYGIVATVLVLGIAGGLYVVALSGESTNVDRFEPRIAYSEADSLCPEDIQKQTNHDTYQNSSVAVIEVNETTFIVANNSKYRFDSEMEKQGRTFTVEIQAIGDDTNSMECEHWLQYSIKAFIPNNGSDKFEFRVQYQNRTLYSLEQNGNVIVAGE